MVTPTWAPTSTRATGPTPTPRASPRASSRASARAAAAASPDRRPKLATITAPTVVLHGADDPLVPLTGGQDTAANIPGAELVVIPGMGHDFPPALFDTLVDGILKAVTRAQGARNAAEVA